MTPKELLDKIFKDPATKYELTEFEATNIDFNKALQLIERPGTGKNTGKSIFYLKTLAPFHSDKEEVQIFVEDGKANPEEIVRQLWVYKLINYYKYDKDEIALEKPITFGSDVGTKFADIIVYTSKEKTTPKIVLEIKKPKRKEGIEQLRSYLNAQGSPIGVWSNGSDKVILYRPYPQEFDALPEIPKKGQTPQDLQDAQLTIAHLDRSFDFKKILLDLEELVLGSSGVNVFNEIFKIIFAKIWDEKQALEVRKGQTLEFKWFKDAELTYLRINHLFQQAAKEWVGIFEPNDKIKLQKEHLNVCIAPLERKRFLGSNLRIIDDAFEYLLPTEAKKKKGQFFTPRYVIDMCVRMLNPKRNEYILDPACGSAGFLVHAMEWAYPAETPDEMELRKSRYAARYLWGVDFEEQAAKTSRALMLIAGDGHTNIFGPDVDTLNPKTWYRSPSGKSLMENLRKYNLTKTPIPNDEIFTDDDKAWDYFEELQFDIILSNPPFAGEVKLKEQLYHYQLAKPALKRAHDKQAKEERDVLFIERIIKMLKPGGRAAIVLPQGKFNNSSLAFIREWILRKARLLAVVGLDGNTFQPHTGTKTSVLFIQKYDAAYMAKVERIQNEVKALCPNYYEQIEELIKVNADLIDIPDEMIPDNIMELLLEEFSVPEKEVNEDDNSDNENDKDDEPQTENNLEEQLELAEENINALKSQLIKAKQNLGALSLEIEALKIQKIQEIELSNHTFDLEINLAELKIKAINYAGVSKEKKEKLTKEKDELSAQVKELKNAKTSAKKSIVTQYQGKETKLKEERIKPLERSLKAEIKLLEKEIPQAQYDKKLLTYKGKLQLIIDDEELVQKLSDRFVDAEVAKRLDYPIFMAVSEKGGKKSNGEYEYLVDEEGNIIEDDNGNPMFNQDLINYCILKSDLADIKIERLKTVDEPKLPAAAEPILEYKVKGKEMFIAEAFVQYAKEQGLLFWKG
jgi:type I restriction enzyme M protein